jgi:archaemetzincin
MPPERLFDRIERVEIVPLEPLEEGVAEEVAARLSLRIEAACPVRRSGLPHPPPLRWLPDRTRQADADPLLLALEADRPEDGAVRVGLTDADLAIPIFTFVFGRARHGGHAAVVSRARLRPGFYGLAEDGELAMRRTLDEVLHELGHVGGLRHCQEPRCLLRFAATVEAIDARGSSFCAACAAGLPPGLRARRGGDQSPIWRAP